MIRLTETTVDIDGDLAPLHEEFRTRRVLKLPGLLSPTLMTRLTRRLAATAWVPREHKGIGNELMPVDGGATMALNFLANTPLFMETIVRITGCEPVTHFIGRVYRMLPDAGHYDGWHSDNISKRRIGMSINLSDAPYDGGTFHYREQDSQRDLGTVPNLTQGDAILFAISGALEHMVTPVVGTQPKTAFAGWFVSDGQGLFNDLKA